MTDFLFRGALADLDPAVFDLNQLEAERQYRKLISDSKRKHCPSCST